MMSSGNFIIKQSNALLENKQYAVLCAVVFSIMPFASWLSVALVSLITLRKGALRGFEVLMPALIIHSVPLMMMLPLESVLVNSLIAFIPCYLAAITLRHTKKWPAVSGIFFLQALLGFLLVQVLVPDFVVEQFSQFQKILNQYQDYQSLLGSSEKLNSFLLAQLFFGIQILSVIVSAILSLAFARSIQARLFMPGGFKSELLEFRSGRLSFLVLMSVSIGTYFEYPLAINLLPLVLGYFLLSGFSLAYYIFARKRQFKVVVLLFLIILLKPSFVLFAYIVFGSLDSVFNLRLYLPTRVRGSI
ncbi:MAG: hypothetical protein Q8M40_11935 [Legionella sp.]|nr:hypothetical protein [Legionella sp.]